MHDTVSKLDTSCIWARYFLYLAQIQKVSRFEIKVILTLNNLNNYRQLKHNSQSNLHIITKLNIHRELDYIKS